MSLSLGIDIGTSGVRTSVLEADGGVLSTARAAHVTQEPDKIDANGWWLAVAHCITAQVAALRELGWSGEEIDRIAVDGTSGSMVLTDANISPVGAALMYNSKGFVAEAKRIRAVCPTTDHITQGSNSALARALRLLGDAERAPAHLLHQADFVAAKLMGVGGLSDFNNALKTGFDPEEAAWPTWIGELIGNSLLPQVDAPGAAWAGLDPAVAGQLGLSLSAQVHAGTTDSIAAFLAAAPMEERVAVTSIGSTLAIKVLSEQRVDLPSMGLYSHRLGDFWLVGGASNTGGAVLAHFFTPDELDHLSGEIDPGTATGLDYYP
ncbi:MAG: FGGY family carbohydrate kinase, partial [Pseudomonadota bacterium]